MTAGTIAADFSALSSLNIGQQYAYLMSIARHPTGCNPGNTATPAHSYKTTPTAAHSYRNYATDPVVAHRTTVTDAAAAKAAAAQATQTALNNALGGSGGVANLLSVFA